MSLTPDFDRLLSLISTTFGENSPRTTALCALLEDLAPQLIAAPATTSPVYGNAVEGGLLAHMLLTLDVALDVARSMKTHGVAFDFDKQELVFASLFHCLGRVGEKDVPLFVEQTSQWHRDNRLENFKFNEQIQYMTTADRTVYLLQAYGVSMSRNELLAIRVSDGMLDKSAEDYFRVQGPRNLLTSLAYIVFTAQLLASRIAVVKNLPTS